MQMHQLPAEHQAQYSTAPLRPTADLVSHSALTAQPVKTFSVFPALWEQRNLFTGITPPVVFDSGN